MKSDDFMNPWEALPPDQKKQWERIYEVSSGRNRGHFQRGANLAQELSTLIEFWRSLPTSDPRREAVRQRVVSISEEMNKPPEPGLFNGEPADAALARVYGEYMRNPEGLKKNDPRLHGWLRSVYGDNNRSATPLPMTDSVRDEDPAWYKVLSRYSNFFNK